MKKILLFILLAVAAPFVLCACNHVHEFGEWQIVNDATCLEEGIRERYCSCGEKETDVISPKGHNYVETVIPPTDDEKGYTEHKCSVCGDTYKDNYVNCFSEGLEYAVSDVGKICVITGIGTCTDTDISIPKKNKRLHSKGNRT